MEEHKMKDGCGGFRMPLHYPSYTKKDYEEMPEWQLDNLLNQYGLSSDVRDLDYKRKYAMGAFLWSTHHDSNGGAASDSPPTTGIKKSNSLLDFMRHFLLGSDSDEE